MRFLYLALDIAVSMAETAPPISSIFHIPALFVYLICQGSYSRIQQRDLLYLCHTCFIAINCWVRRDLTASSEGTCLVHGFVCINLCHPGLLTRPERHPDNIVFGCWRSVCILRSGCGNEPSATRILGKPSFMILAHNVWPPEFGYLLKKPWRC
jgi:hypothetical protein